MQVFNRKNEKIFVKKCISAVFPLAKHISFLYNNFNTLEK